MYTIIKIKNDGNAKWENKSSDEWNIERRINIYCLLFINECVCELLDSVKYKSNLSILFFIYFVRVTNCQIIISIDIRVFYHCDILS